MEPRSRGAALLAERSSEMEGEGVRRPQANLLGRQGRGYFAAEHPRLQAGERATGDAEASYGSQAAAGQCGQLPTCREGGRSARPRPLGSSRRLPRRPALPASRGPADQWVEPRWAGRPACAQVPMGARPARPDVSAVVRAAPRRGRACAFSAFLPASRCRRDPSPAVRDPVSSSAPSTVRPSGCPWARSPRDLWRSGLALGDWRRARARRPGGPRAAWGMWMNEALSVGLGRVSGERRRPHTRSPWESLPPRRGGQAAVGAERCWEGARLGLATGRVFVGRRTGQALLVQLFFEGLGFGPGQVSRP
jgi:hypothetical protein